MARTTPDTRPPLDPREAVVLEADGIRIRGKHVTIMCASLFYFRIPEGLWEDRMRKIRAAGYNAIDVYFPWNFHELEKDRWDLSTGMRDVERFLALAAHHDLYVVARPGPYICSEWDGGGLPAYLQADRAELRQNDPGFLGRVREWYGRILPRIAAHEIGAGGSVILLQIENELDFYDCADVPGYVTALRDMAREHGIRVPVFACAGQGDLFGAWGDVTGVAPAMNLYLSSRLRGLEQGLAPYVEFLRTRGVPLMVTETGRDVLLLRRLLAAGAKLVGPYNQVAGYDFGFTAGTNNWGDPLSFQTTHYDFDSLITPFGEVRDAVWEHWALSRFVSCLGARLAGAVTDWDHCIAIEAGPDLASGEAPAMRLAKQGGWLLALTNAGDAPATVRLTRRGARWPRGRAMVLPGGTSRFALFDVPLASWGIPGTILFSSAEPIAVSPDGDPCIVFRADGGGEVCYDVGAGPGVFTFGGDEIETQVLHLEDGRKLTLRGVTRLGEGLAALPEIGAGGVPGTRPAAAGPRPSTPVSPLLLARVSCEELFGHTLRTRLAGSPAMEHAGHLRGYGLYRARADLPHGRPSIGLLVRGGADVVSAYADGTHLGTRAPAGCDAWFPLPRGTGSTSEVWIRCEIWGHCNFDDARKPALRMSSLKGITGATLISTREPVTRWRVQPGGAGGRELPYFASLGGRLTTQVPAHARYEATIRVPAEANRSVLWLEGVECPSTVEVDGRAAGTVDRYHQSIDLTSMTPPGREVVLTMVPQKRYYAEPAGTAFLLAGTDLDDWELGGMQEAELLASALAVRPAARPCVLPLTIERGAVAWLYASMNPQEGRECRSLAFAGADIKATVLFNDVVVGRIFLPAACRPTMAGGRHDLAYLPGCWSRESGDAVRVLLEAVGEEPGRLEGIAVAPIR